MRRVLSVLMNRPARPALLALLALLCIPAGAQRPRMKLDALGLPPFPGATNVGHISLPLAAILKPEPGQVMTGPKLTDLAIQTYRTPLTVSVDRIARFYLKYAAEAGWRLLDDIPESATNRSLVFWSPDAPGYLTVELQPGPENTRQIDLTRLLGEVDPSRPGEVLRLTGKRVREQQVTATITGRFLDLKTNKFVRQTLPIIEARAEGGLGVEAARWVLPVSETYTVDVRVTDAQKKMTRADMYAGNGTEIAEAAAPRPTGALHLTGTVRGAQNPTLRVVISGPLPPAPTPAPAGSAATPAAKPAPTPADTKPAITVLTEWYGLRPPASALLEVRRATSTNHTEAMPPEEVEVGPTCDGPITRTVAWEAETTDQFDFPEEYFGGGFPRAPVGIRPGVFTVEFPKGSGTSNVYILNRNKITTLTKVEIGYAFNGNWVKLPSGKPNPRETTYTSVSLNAPILTRRSSGDCPPPVAPPSSATLAPSPKTGPSNPATPSKPSTPSTPPEPVRPIEPGPGNPKRPARPGPAIPLPPPAKP